MQGHFGGCRWSVLACVARLRIPLTTSSLRRRLLGGMRRQRLMLPVRSRYCACYRCGFQAGGVVGSQPSVPCHPRQGSDGKVQSATRPGALSRSFSLFSRTCQSREWRGARGARSLAGQAPALVVSAGHLLRQLRPVFDPPTIPLGVAGVVAALDRTRHAHSTTLRNPLQHLLQHGSSVIHYGTLRDIAEPVTGSALL